jgi:putative ABC transport system substrate-binding protein
MRYAPPRTALGWVTVSKTSCAGRKVSSRRSAIPHRWRVALSALASERLFATDMAGAQALASESHCHYAQLVRESSAPAQPRPGDAMKRRDIIALLGCAAAWPLTTRSQQAPARLAFMGTGAEETSRIFVGALKDGLRELGLTEGRDYVLDTSWAEGAYDRFPALTQELLMQQPRVVLVETLAAVRAAQSATQIPIVMISINDPVGAGVITSLGRPGGNTTGTANLNEDLTPKLTEMVRAAVPGATFVAALMNPNNSSAKGFLERLTVQTARVGLSVRPFEARASSELPAAFERVAGARPDALVIVPDQIFLDGHRIVAALALQHRLALFSTIPEMTDAGALLSYGVVRRALYHRTAYFVKRILDGANAGELPVEQPTRVELAFNLKTAKALNLPLSDTLLTLADRVIE